MKKGSKSSTKTVNYKALTLKAWGVKPSSPAHVREAAEVRYKREYTHFAKQVRNYNRTAGTTYSAASMLYYAEKNDPRDYSYGLRGILQTPATTPSKAGAGTGVVTKGTTKAANAVIKDKWAGAIDRSQTVKQYWDDLEKGLITPAEFNRLAGDWSKKRKTRRGSDPTYKGSD